MSFQNRAADKARESGTADNLIKLVDDAVAKGILERLNIRKKQRNTQMKVLKPDGNSWGIC